MPERTYVQTIYCLILILTKTFTSIASPQTPTPYALVSGEFAPYVGKDLKHGGVATEIVQSVISAMGQQSEITYLPWRRGHIRTLQHDFLAIYPYSLSDERLEIWHFSDSLYNLSEIVISKKEKAFVYRDFNSLKDLTICKPIGYNLFDLKSLHEKGLIKIERPPNLKACFLMLNIGRVDLVITNTNTASSMIESLNLEHDIFMEQKIPFKHISHHLISPKDNPDAKAFIDQFNNTFRQLKRSGKIKSIINQHL